MNRIIHKVPVNQNLPLTNNKKSRDSNCHQIIASLIKIVNKYKRCLKKLIKNNAKSFTTKKVRKVQKLIILTAQLTNIKISKLLNSNPSLTIKG